MFDDLREFIKKAEEIGQISVLENADWDLEIGLITELGAYHSPPSPALLFDKIKGYEPGYRILTNFLNTDMLKALTCGFPLKSTKMEMVGFWKEKFKKGYKAVPPVEVKTGPIMENIDTGKSINLFKFPVPMWHKLDGGRYIGTSCAVINKDPDSGWVNLGTYRVQAFDKKTCGMYMAPGRDGDIIRKKYWDKGLACPTAVVCGCEPLLFSAAASSCPMGVCEYDYAGWLRNKPIEVIRGKVTGLPLPANAEIVLEGECMPPDVESRQEGPFGEYTGYYGGGAKNESVFRVKSVMYRNNPILLGAPPLVGQSAPLKRLENCGRMWMHLEEKLPAIKGVWEFSEAGGPAFTVISLEQKFAGHAKQATMLISGYYSTAEVWRFIVAVDEDIDPTNISDVLWALGMRCDPAEDIDILRGCRGTRLDPRITPENRAVDNFVHSRALINACKPYHWIKQFPASIRSSVEEIQKTKNKWGKLIW